MALKNLPALEGGTPVRKTPLPYARHGFAKEEIDAVSETLKSVWITTGPREKEFSEKFAEYVGAKHAVAVNSCTAALHLSLAALGIGPEDEVVTTPLTFVATTFAVMYCGAKPVFADITDDTYNIDPDSVKKKITKKTKAILPVHYSGNPADMKSLKSIAKKNGLKIVEDAAHASGAEYRGKRIGTIGDLTCFSFHAIKNITTAEGGMITTESAALAKKLKTMCFFGIPNDAYKRSYSPKPWHYDVMEYGFKYNMTDIAAALGLAQLEKLNRFNAARARLTCLYDKAFAHFDEVIAPSVTSGAKSSNHLYVIRLREGALRVDRDHVLAAMRAENVMANLHYTPVYRHPFFARKLKLNPSDFPVCEKVSRTIMTLPLFPTMTEEDVDSVVRALRKIFDYYRK